MKLSHISLTRETIRLLCGDMTHNTLLDGALNINYAAHNSLAELRLHTSLITQRPEVWGDQEPGPGGLLQLLTLLITPFLQLCLQSP